MKYNKETGKYEFSSELEEEFAQLNAGVLPLIDQELLLAEEAIERAIAISEKHGVPFTAYFMKASNTYMPEKYREKYKELNYYCDEEISCYGWVSSFC